MTKHLEELRRGHAADVCDTIRRYILDGHKFGLVTEHGEDGEHRVSFLLPEWNAFIGMLEPREPEAAREAAVSRPER